MKNLYLFDIEGTTTDINFVHKVLFPYSYERMDIFIHNNLSQVEKSLKDVQETILTEKGIKLNPTDCITTLKEWIKTDRKHRALKEIQGFIWDEGYAKGDFKGHVYPDVKPFFNKLKKLGHSIGIYSSGSVHAQKQIFKNSIDGDLTTMISYYFDTLVGAKREKESYLRIAHQSGFSPNEIHFFSDIPQELEAAQSAGLKITHLKRPGTSESEYEFIESFEEFKI